MHGNVFEYEKGRGWKIGPGAVLIVAAVLCFILLYSKKVSTFELFWAARVIWGISL
ncbi:MAG: hypothetical protein JOY62_13430 [Acidobacteriaceae bacterium]|nr:hypothetical protein [Acidobacteriaceae bacterium]MBV9780963.1 hypothetical protein [Acidobacteriaceae bacterium]